MASIFQTLAPINQKDEQITHIKCTKPTEINKIDQTNFPKWIPIASVGVFSKFRKLSLSPTVLTTAVNWFFRVYHHRQHKHECIRDGRLSQSYTHARTHTKTFTIHACICNTWRRYISRSYAQHTYIRAFRHYPFGVWRLVPTSLFRCVDLKNQYPWCSVDIDSACVCLQLIHSHTHTRARIHMYAARAATREARPGRPFVNVCVCVQCKDKYVQMAYDHNTRGHVNGQRTCNMLDSHTEYIRSGWSVLWVIQVWMGSVPLRWSYVLMHVCMLFCTVATKHHQPSSTIIFHMQRRCTLLCAIKDFDWKIHLFCNLFVIKTKQKIVWLNCF